MTLIPPNSGRACVRKLKDGVAVVGVMHFESDQFQPNELASYPLAYIGAGVEICVASEMLSSADIFGYEPVSIDDYSSSNVWRSGSTQELHVDSVRFAKSRDGANSYSFLSISKQDPYAKHPECLHLQDRAHYFVDFQDGYAIPGNQEEVRLGMSLMGLLRDLPIWPDANGVMKTASDLSTRGREIYDSIHSLHLRKAANAIGDECYLRHLEEFNPHVIANVLNEADYGKFILVTHEYGMHRPSGYSFTNEEYNQRNAFSSAAIRAIKNNSLNDQITIDRLRSISDNERTPVSFKKEAPTLAIDTPSFGR